MASIRPPMRLRDQKCPICGAQLAPGALSCQKCGTDLSRAGAIFSTGVKPTKIPRHRRGTGKGALKPVLLAAGMIVGLVALGSVPAVGARVPVLGDLSAAIRATLERTWMWARAVAGRPSVSDSRNADPGDSVLQGIGATVTINSTPPGAEVILNAAVIGITPVTIEHVPPGTYNLIMTHPLYGAVSRVLRVDDQPVSLHVQLYAAGSAPPSLGARPQDETRTALAVGVPAPGFVLKDRTGVIFRLENFRGRKAAVLFVWRLDDASELAIRELDARVRQTGPRAAGIIVMMRPDRPALRNFLANANIRLPVLFGTPEVIRAYQVPDGVNALYLISERGMVENRQVGTLSPSTVLR
jgi:peroxiredoxin